MARPQPIIIQRPIIKDTGWSDLSQSISNMTPLLQLLATQKAKKEQQAQAEQLLQGLLTQPAPEGGISIPSSSPVEQQQNTSDMVNQARQMISGLESSQQSAPTETNPLLRLQQFFRNRTPASSASLDTMKITGSPEPNISPQGNFLLNLPKGQMMNPREYGMAKAAMMTNPEEFGKALTGMMFPKPATNEYTIQEGFLLNKNDGTYTPINQNKSKQYKAHVPLGDKQRIFYTDGSSEDVPSIDTNTPEFNTFYNGYMKENPEAKITDAVKAYEEVQKMPSTNISINTEKKFWDRIAEKSVDDIFEQRKAAKDAVSARMNIKEAKKLAESGIYTGSSANIKLGFDKWLQTVNINIGGEKASNTEAFAATTGRLVGKVIKEFGSGTGLSDADREYAEKIAGGKITLTSESINKILDIADRLFKAQTDIYNKGIEQLMKDPKSKDVPFDLRVYDIPGNISGNNNNLQNISTEELFKELNK